MNALLFWYVFVPAHALALVSILYRAITHEVTK